MTSYLELGILIIAGLISLFSSLFWRPLLEKNGTFDVPNHRSSHVKPTLRGGGLGPMSGLVIAVIAGVFVFDRDADLYLMFLIASFSLLICWIGLVEDLKGIPAKVRAILQVVLGLMFGCLIAIHIESGWIWIPLATLFFAANVNFINFMDGINGISGMFAVAIGLSYAAIGWVEDQYVLYFCGLLIAVIFVPFLYWNLTPPGMFLGDVGSYLLGGLTATLVLTGIWIGINPIAMLAPISIYWVDAVRTLIKRAALREPLFEAHRTHIYQQLTNYGLSHVNVALIVAAYSAIAGAIGFLILLSSSGKAILLLAGLVFLWMSYLALPTLLKSRKAVS